MINEDLANLTCELVSLLTVIYCRKEIGLETYISNTKYKINFLEAFIKKNTNCCQNTRIIKLLIQHRLILGNLVSIP